MARPKKVVEETESNEEFSGSVSFDVMNHNGDFVRCYSVESHGEKAEELANEFANKIGGKVK